MLQRIEVLPVSFVQKSTLQRAKPPKGAIIFWPMQYKKRSEAGEVIPGAYQRTAHANLKVAVVAAGLAGGAH